MADLILCNGKYYALDTRTYDRLPFDGNRVIPDPDHPEWTYTYKAYNKHIISIIKYNLSYNIL